MLSKYFVFRVYHQVDVICLILESYSIQLEITARDLSPHSGSLFGINTRKSCGPPIPAGILNSMKRVALSPGLSTIELMVGVGGQHPSLTSIKGASLNLSAWVPVLVSWKAAWTL